ncbi:MAG: 30S ribosomal protein S3 [Candidatus Altarchaeaceae archaeon]
MSLTKIFINKGKTLLNLENYLKSEIGTGGYSGINIQRTPLSTRIVLYVERPPLVIGRSGTRISELTENIQEKFGIDDPAIDVQSVKDPYLDAQIMAFEIATAIEKGENPRRIAKRALESIISHGAVGAQVQLSGKLVGKGERGRTEKFYKGYMKKSGFPLNSVNVGKAQAKLKQGIIGVEVRILQPNISFPDQIKIKQAVSQTSTQSTNSQQNKNGNMESK